MIIMQSSNNSPESISSKSTFDQHPTVVKLRGRPKDPAPSRWTLAQIRALAMECGADDASAVSLDHPEVAEERETVLRAFSQTKTLIVIALKTHREDIRSLARSVSNLEFHRTGHEVDEVLRRIAVRMSELGIATVNPAMAFPMEMDQFPGRMWVVSHKRVAQAAQLGRMGLHRNVIHPQFGSFILLGTVLSTVELADTPTKLDFDPCVQCKLCVAACPVGAIEPEGGFRFSACNDHNYREFMSGFADVLEHVADSKDSHELRERLSISETASVWQSLAYKPNYKAAYCIAVCPAGEDVLAPFLTDRAGFLKQVVKPLTEKVEPVYVVAGSDAEAHVKKRFPHKRVRVVRSSLRVTKVASFFRSISLTFQRGPAKGWKATFHFDLSGDTPVQATVRIDDGQLSVEQGLVGECDLLVQADGQLWIDIVNKKRNPVLAVLTRKLKTRGDRSLLNRFAACFPR